MASRWKIVAAHGGDDDMSGANDSVIDVDGEEIVSWSMATNDIDEFGVTSTLARTGNRCARVLCVQSITSFEMDHARPASPSTSTISAKSS